MSKKINVLDVFSGCWGLTEWFLKEDYSFIGHIEMDKYACESLKTRILFDHLNKIWKLEDYKKYLIKSWELSISKKNNFLKNIVERDELIKKYKLEKEIDKVYNTEISDETYPELLKKLKDNLWNNKLDILIWWPPCQTYSQIGRARVGARICEDPRNFLYLQYVKFLKDLQPEMFVFENVPWLKTAWKGKYLADIRKAIDDAWYYMETDEKLVKQYMPKYGIPQNRTRLILIWWKKNSKIINEYPKFKKNENYDYIVNDFLKDLPKIKEWWWSEIMKYSEDNMLLEKLWIRNKNIDFAITHYTRPIRELDREIYKIAVKQYKKDDNLKYTDLPKELQTHKNTKSFQNRFNVVRWKEKITSTIVAHIASDGHYYIHPDIKQNRSLSVREAARLQTFPDDFKFEWTRTAIFKQIWNAVPPMFSNIVAKELKKYFNKK